MPRCNPIHGPPPTRDRRQYWIGSRQYVRLISPRLCITESKLLRPTPWNGVYCASKAALHSITETLQMECRPLGVSVMLMAIGSVKSNLAANQARVFALPPSTLYGAFYKAIVQRMHMSQGPASMPTADFARGAVKKVLQRSPPRYVTVGGMTRTFQFLLWLPRGLALWVVWKALSKA